MSVRSCLLCGVGFFLGLTVERWGWPETTEIRSGWGGSVTAGNINMAARFSLTAVPRECLESVRPFTCA